MLGTICEQLKTHKDIEIVIASGDMDTMQLVDDHKVQVYTLRKGIKDTILYDEDAVNERYGFSPLQLPDYKGLRGDPSDNIIGIKGIGDKTATILIQKFGIVESEITPDANLVKDLGIDSLDYAELVMDFEQTFDIKISDEDAEKMQTIGQAVKYIDSKRKKS